MFFVLTKMTPHFPDAKKIFLPDRTDSLKIYANTQPKLNAFRYDFSDTQYFSRRFSYPDSKTKENYFSLIHSKKFDKLHLVDKKEKTYDLLTQA